MIADQENNCVNLPQKKWGLARGFEKTHSKAHAAWSYSPHQYLPGGTWRSREACAALARSNIHCSLLVLSIAQYFQGAHHETDEPERLFTWQSSHTQFIGIDWCQCSTQQHHNASYKYIHLHKYPVRISMSILSNEPLSHPSSGSCTASADWACHTEFYKTWKIHCFEHWTVCCLTSWDITSTVYANKCKPVLEPVCAHSGLGSDQRRTSL